MPHERDPLKKEKNMTGIKGTMDAYIEGFDWGCGVTKLYLHLDSPLAELKADDVLMLRLRETKSLPIAELATRTGISKKVLERHRKYIITAAEIVSGDYPLLKEYIPL